MGSRTRRATMRRTSGATTRTVGNATAQEDIQDDPHKPMNVSLNPMARNVAMPETISDIIPDRRKPNRNGAARGGMQTYLFMKCDEIHTCRNKVQPTG